MSDTTPQAPQSHFDAIKHVDESGEYWSARELATLLDYTEWRNFEKVIKKAIKACQSSNKQVSDHFVDINKMIATAKGAQREIKDYQLSRYACYLVVQNGDPQKEIVALGQTYFAIRTRHDELEEQTNLEAMKHRLALRQRLKQHNKTLRETARDAGVITGADFALFENHGYQGLYNGLTAQGIAETMGVPPGQISDHMGELALSANDFRATLGAYMLKQRQVTDKGTANATHYEAGKHVRETMKAAGVPMPEELPAEPHIKEIEQAIKRQEQIEKEDRLGLWGQAEDEPEK